VVFQLFFGNLLTICKGGCIHTGLIYIIQTAYALVHPVVNETIVSPAKIISLGLDMDVVIILTPIHINHFQNIKGNLCQIVLLKHTGHQYISLLGWLLGWLTAGLRLACGWLVAGSWMAFDGSWDVLALLRRSAMVWFVRRLYFINFNQFFSYIAKYRTFLSTRVYKK